MLTRSPQEHPEVLTLRFIQQLGPCLQALVSLGFAPDQACRAVVAHPPLVQHRRGIGHGVYFVSLTPTGV